MSVVKLPQKNLIRVEEANIRASLLDDPYSDRVRCDHPLAKEAAPLAQHLIEAAESSGRGKVMTMVDSKLATGLESEGFKVAGVMPSYYQGERDCAVLTLNLDENRRQLANPIEVEKVHNIVSDVDHIDDRELIKIKRSAETHLATNDDAQEIADLLGSTFKDYPTPSSSPDYIREQISSGTPFRYIKDQEAMIACASADLVTQARAAELTDCATNPMFRKRGLMGKILTSLMFDLERLNFPTAYTFSRARIAGINVVFKKLGFKWCGRLSKSCRIGEGLEDMNMWCRKIDFE